MSHLLNDHILHYVNSADYCSLLQNLRYIFCQQICVMLLKMKLTITCSFRRVFVKKVYEKENGSLTVFIILRQTPGSHSTRKNKNCYKYKVIVKF